MESSRFPGKPLYPLLGIPMVGHCYFRTKMVKGITETFVATCDEEIKSYIESIGGKAIMTAKSHQRATERTSEALEIIEYQTKSRIDVIIMVQGDEPLIPPSSISLTLEHFEDPKVEIVNIMSRFKNREQFEDFNNVKVVVNRFSDAMYFSREPIPSAWKGIKKLPMFNQTGVIAFRRDKLNQFNKMPESSLEKIESIDMNRILENGENVRMVLANSYTIGIDTIEETKYAEKFLKDDSTFNLYNDFL